MIWCKSESFLSFSAMNSPLSARDIVFFDFSLYIDEERRQKQDKEMIGTK